MARIFTVLNRLSRWKSGLPPLAASVSVRLITYHVAGTGVITVGAELATDREVDECIDSLIADLNAVRKRAKKQLMEQQKKTLAALTETSQFTLDR